jgi:hypothetical protein
MCQRCYMQSNSPQYNKNRRTAFGSLCDEDKEKLRAHQRRYRRTRLYGLSPQDQRAMLEGQNNTCAICPHEFSDGSYHVDHCHKTGKVRGLLCQKCNRGLGHFNDETLRLERAKAYLEAHNQLI